MTVPRRKLIEVALPLDAINAASAREKSIRHGHPGTLHLWWARRPLAACRAVLFGQLVDDPSSWPERFKTEEARDTERQRLFGLLCDLVRWKSSNDETILLAAQLEIAQSLARNRREDGAADAPEEEILRIAPSYTGDGYRALSDEEKRAIHAYLAKAPPLHDPFAGGGSIPLEAQRLGLRAISSDLNPVAVLLNKALIEIPPKFAARPPVHPEGREKAELAGWKGARGLAEDVRQYGKWLRDEAWRRIGHLYPKVTLRETRASSPTECGLLLSARRLVRKASASRRAGVPGGTATRVPPGNTAVKSAPQVARPSDYLLASLEEPGHTEATVIAWLWARTVPCPNPACGARMPLARSFALSSKEGKKARVEPRVERINGIPALSFSIVYGQGVPPRGTVGRKGARCIACKKPVSLAYLRAEGRAKRMGAELMAIVAQGKNKRVFLSPRKEHALIAERIKPSYKPEPELPKNPRDCKTPGYGMRTFGDLFTPRQLTALTTFSDLVGEARERVEADALAAGMPLGEGLESGGAGARAYAEAVALYLGVGVGKLSDAQSSLCRWKASMSQSIATFARQALPMVWDYAESNPFGGKAGDISTTLHTMMRVLDSLPVGPPGEAYQAAAQSIDLESSCFLSTDPPYYDNIGYADLSDFFYVWLRRTLRPLFPTLFASMLVPKDQELVATPYRHGGKEAAERFFLDGMKRALENLARSASEHIPTTIYYAFKQKESPGAFASSTGWETFLEALLHAGFSVVSTWPVRTELGNRMVGKDANALASSIVLVCRKRPQSAPSTDRAAFRRMLRQKLPRALRELQQGNIAPVDMAQASIGPGMGIFSRYQKVLEADGAQMSVRTALQLINQALDEYLREQEGELDAYTRFALTWFETRAFAAGAFGEAETLARARNVSVAGMAEAGILYAAAGRVRLLRREELPGAWSPEAARGRRGATVWEATQHLIRRVQTRGEEAGAALLARLGPLSSPARDLAYRLYTICERRGWAGEARTYNGLVIAWPELKALAAKAARSTDDGEGRANR